MQRFKPTADEFDLYAPRYVKALYDFIIAAIGGAVMFLLMFICAYFG